MTTLTGHQGVPSLVKRHSQDRDLLKKPSLLAQAWNQEVTTYAGQQGVPSEVTALYPQPHLPELCEHASCRKSIGKHHQAKATAGADAGPSSVFRTTKKRKSKTICDHNPAPSAGPPPPPRPPGRVRLLSNPPLHHALYHVRPFRRSQVHCSLAGGALGRQPRGSQAALHLRVGTTVI